MLNFDHLSTFRLSKIYRMEEEAARITKETEELEQKKNAKATGTSDAAKATGGDAPSQDG